MLSVTQCAHKSHKLIRPKLLSEAQMNNRRPLVRLPASSSHFDTRAIFCRSRFSFSLAGAARRPYSSPTILLPILLLITGGKGGRVSGVSSGSIIALLYSLGYSPKEMREIFFEIDFASLEDKPCIFRVKKKIRILQRQKTRKST